LSLGPNLPDGLDKVRTCAKFGKIDPGPAVRRQNLHVPHALTWKQVGQWRHLAPDLLRVEQPHLRLGLARAGFMDDFDACHTVFPDCHQTFSISSFTASATALKA